MGNPNDCEMDFSVLELQDRLKLESESNSMQHNHRMNLMAKFRCDTLQDSSHREGLEKFSRYQKLRHDDQAWNAYQADWHTSQQTEISGHSAQIVSRLAGIQQRLDTSAIHRQQHEQTSATVANAHRTAERIAMERDWQYQMSAPGGRPHPHAHPLDRHAYAIKADSMQAQSSASLPGNQRDPIKPYERALISHEQNMIKHSMANHSQAMREAAVERDDVWRSNRMREHQADVVRERGSQPTAHSAQLPVRQPTSSPDDPLAISRARVWFLQRCRVAGNFSKADLAHALQTDPELCSLLGIQVGAMPQMEFSPEELNESLQMVQFEKFFVQLSESLNMPLQELIPTGSATRDPSEGHEHQVYQRLEGLKQRLGIQKEVVADTK